MKKETAEALLKEAYAKGLDLNHLKAEAAKLLDQYSVMILDLMEQAGIELPLTARDRKLISLFIGSCFDMDRDDMNPIVSGWLGLAEPEFFREVLG